MRSTRGFGTNAAWSYDSTHIHRVTQAGNSSFTYTYDANGEATVPMLPPQHS